MIEQQKRIQLVELARSMFERGLRHWWCREYIRKTG